MAESNSPQTDSKIRNAMKLALEMASRFAGATSPNPPVGAAALDSSGEILAVEAHRRAGTAHAEPRVIQACREKGVLEKLHTLVVTLEPCNYHGRTPPCSETIIELRIPHVVYGATDPNPKVNGGGIARLRSAGVSVERIGEPLLSECEKLIRTFAHWIKTGRPWVTLKTAHQADGSMIPPAGKTTFTSPSSLVLAHELRKRADAILTGSGTILADSPRFTVREVADHPEKKRCLVVLDRRNRVPSEWTQAASDLGFEVLKHREITEALDDLGKRGCLEVLVEAGPGLSEAVLKQGIWNEHVRITRSAEPDSRDQIEYVYRNY